MNYEEEAPRAHKLAVIFPGIGYRTDKPLLYYAKRLALDRGYMIREVHYRGFPEEINKKNASGRRELLELAMDQTRNLLRSLPVEENGELLFISKSIGTAVACAYANECERPARHVLYTPLEETSLAGVTDAIAFHGTKDKYARTEILKEHMKEAKIPLHLFEDANHSMETRNTLQDVAVLSRIMKLTDEYLSADV